MDFERGQERERERQTQKAEIETNPQNTATRTEEGRNVSVSNSSFSIVCVDAWMQGLKNVLLRITIHTSGAYIQTYTVHMAYYMSEKLATDTTYVL